MEENRDFKGIWIPKEIWLNKELSLLEKIVYVEIDSLDNENHCTAGNEYFAKFCDCSESKISKIIKKLQDLQLIEILNFDGRHRKIRVVKNTKQPSKIYKADSYNLRPINKNKLISKDINSSKNNNIDNKEVEWFVNNYHSICSSLPRVMRLSDKRKKDILKILNTFSKDNILECFRQAEASDFLKGNNDSGWKANLDFILREDKFIKILEGGYGNRQPLNKNTINNIEHMNGLSDRADKKGGNNGKEY